MNSNILLVDDEVECLHTMALILTLHGCNVIKFTNAERALQELLISQSSDNPVDLLITDIEMPQMRGDELIDELQKHGITISTIVMTGHGDKELVIDLLRKGCNDYIDKPVTPEILIKRVSLALNQVEKHKTEQDQSEKLVELGSYANELIHDINNMLCTSCGFADLAQIQFTSDKLLNNYLSKISNSTAYASRLTSQLLSVSQRKNINFCKLNLSMEITQWHDMLKIVAGKNIRIHTDTPLDIPDIIADQVSIERLLMNLVIISRSTMPHGGDLNIAIKKLEPAAKNGSNGEAGKPGTYVCLSLTYSSSAIDNEALHQICQPYSMLKTKNDKTSRSLSSIKKIIHDHKGKIDILHEQDNNPGFIILFPTA